MGFLSSLRGLVKHEPVVTTSPTVLSSDPVRTPLSHSHETQHDTTSPTRVTTQRPAPSTPSPRAHA